MESHNSSPTDADLRPYGYIPGEYQIICVECGRQFDGMDKRALACRACAEAEWRKVQEMGVPEAAYHRVMGAIGAPVAEALMKCTDDAGEGKVTISRKDLGDILNLAVSSYAECMRSKADDKWIIELAKYFARRNGDEGWGQIADVIRTYAPQEEERHWEMAGKAALRILGKEDGEAPDLPRLAMKLRGDSDLGNEAMGIIRKMLTEQNVPFAAYLDDHVSNALVERKDAMERIKELEEENEDWRETVLNLSRAYAALLGQKQSAGEDLRKIMEEVYKSGDVRSITIEQDEHQDL